MHRIHTALDPGILRVYRVATALLLILILESHAAFGLVLRVFKATRFFGRRAVRRGRKRIDGIRYGKVQFNAEESIDWWVDAFCQKTRGATLYRLRDDLIFAEDTP